MGDGTGEWAVALPARVRQVREAQGIPPGRDADAAGLTVDSYLQVEQGARTLKGAELVLLADLFGVRAGRLLRPPAPGAPGAVLRDRLHAYLEVSSYLHDAGIDAGPGGGSTERSCIAGRGPAGESGGKPGTGV